MLHYSRWKTLAIIGSVLLAIVLTLPNILPASVIEKLKPYNLKPITLGLDLQGGSNVLFEIDRSDLKGKLTQQITGDIRASLREAKIGYNGINRNNNGVTVRITKPEDIERAQTELKKLQQPVTTGLLGSGTAINLFDLSQQDQQFTMTFSEVGVDAKIAAAVPQIIEIMQKRLNGVGIAEITIQQQGKDRIVFQIPGVQDPDKILKLIGTTAKLTFQLVCESQPTAAGQKPPPECEALTMKENPSQTMWVQTSSRATVDGADLNDA